MGRVFRVPATTRPGGIGDPQKLAAVQADKKFSALGWNPMGTGNYEISSATVTSFVDTKGHLHDAGNCDDRPTSSAAAS